MDGFYNPYADISGGRWIKTQLHIHAGRRERKPDYSVEDVLEAYRIAGYELVMNSPQKWWEDITEIGKRIGVSTMNGNEYAEYDGILLCGTKELHTGSPQEVIDACAKDGGFSVICHPNIQLPPENPVLDRETALGLTGAVGVEIFNGCILRRMPGNGLATDFWDRALSQGKILWGFGSDDFHDFYEMNVGWTVIHAKSTEHDDIKESCVKGRLYTSTGLVLYDFHLEGNELEVTADYPFDRLGGVTYRFVGEGGKILGACTDDSGKYVFTGSERYVRTECVAPDGSMLWCQPVLNASYYDISFI